MATHQPLRPRRSATRPRVPVRAALGLCLSLLLVACSGGYLATPSGPAPTRAPRARAARAQTVVAPGSRTTAEPTPDPQTALGAGAPEAVAGLLAGPERDRYLSLLAAIEARDPAAADWLASTGTLLRDGKLDGPELQTLELLPNGKGDPLYYVTHARVFDGVGDQDFQYFQANVVNPLDNWYFNDDISGLEAFELLSKEGQRSLQRIFVRAHEDPEVRKGLYLMNFLGLPDTRAYKYPVRSYNVQLYLLARLLEQGVPGEYERAAVAAALTYGSLLPFSDQEGREQVCSYAAERLRFLIDTDVTLAAAGARWRAADYPLEGLVLVLWGGQAAAYPDPQLLPSQSLPLAQAAVQRPLPRADLDRVLLSLDNLRQMQGEMLRAVVEQSADEATAAGLVEQWWSTNRRDDPDTGGPNPNQQWARQVAGQGFAGGTESAYMLAALAASINLPLPWAQLWYARDGQLQVVPYGLWLDPATRTLEMGASAQHATTGLPADTPAVLVWWRAPWDNWHLGTSVRTCLTVPLPLSAWRAGIPSGYLLRQGVAKEEEAKGALGVVPTPTPAPVAMLIAP